MRCRYQIAQLPDKRWWILNEREYPVGDEGFLTRREAEEEAELITLMEEDDEQQQWAEWPANGAQ